MRTIIVLNSGINVEKFLAALARIHPEWVIIERCDQQQAGNACPLAKGGVGYGKLTLKYCSQCGVKMPCSACVPLVSPIGDDPMVKVTKFLPEIISGCRVIGSLPVSKVASADEYWEIENISDEYEVTLRQYGVVAIGRANSDDVDKAGKILRDVQSSALITEFKDAKESLPTGYVMDNVHSVYEGNHPENGNQDGYSLVAVPAVTDIIGIKTEVGISHLSSSRNEGWGMMRKIGVLEWDGDSWSRIDLNETPYIIVEQDYLLDKMWKIIFP